MEKRSLSPHHVREAMQALTEIGPFGIGKADSRAAQLPPKTTPSTPAPIASSAGDTAMAAKIDRLLAERDERERKATEEAKTARLTVMIDSLLKWERSADTRATFDSQATYVRACLVDAGFDPATDAVAAECFRISRLSE